MTQDEQRKATELYDYLHRWAEQVDRQNAVGGDLALANELSELLGWPLTVTWLLADNLAALAMHADSTTIMGFGLRVRLAGAVEGARIEKLTKTQRALLNALHARYCA